MPKKIIIYSMVAIAIGCVLAVFGRARFQATPANTTQSGEALWTQKLAEAQRELQRNPESAFWHSQAAVAYDNLDKLREFEREIDQARKLDAANPIYHYMAYSVYKRRDMNSQREEALKRAVEADPVNPLGHFEMGHLYESREDWTKALEEYRATEKLLRGAQPGRGLDSKVEYVDPRGNPFSLERILQSLPEAIKRVSSHMKGQ